MFSKQTPPLSFVFRLKYRSFRKRSLLKWSIATGPQSFERQNARGKTRAQTALLRNHKDRKAKQCRQVLSDSNHRMRSSSPLLKEASRMRSRFWILLLAIHCLALTATAQNPAKRQIVLQLSTGGFVAFRSETPGSKSAPESKTLASLLYSQALAGDNRIIHRVLTDAEQNVVFGYDLWV